MMDISKLKELVALMAEHDLAEVEVKNGEEAITIRRAGVIGQAPVVQYAPASQMAAAAQGLGFIALTVTMTFTSMRLKGSLGREPSFREVLRLSRATQVLLVVVGLTVLYSLVDLVLLVVRLSS